MSIATDVWFAYVVNHIMDRCRVICKEHCKGCQLKWKSAFLHQHEQLSLLEKVDLYLEQVRGNLLGVELESLYRRFTKTEPLSTPKEELLQQTTSIIHHATPRSLYYGRWMTVEHDIIFHNMFMKRKRNKRKKLEKVQSTETQKPLHTTKAYKRKYKDTSGSHTPVSSPSGTQNQQTIEDILWECLSETNDLSCINFVE